MSGTAPPQGPPPASRPSPERSPLERVDWAGVVHTDWLGPLKVAGVILGVAAVLAVLIGLGGRPAIPGLHWTVRTTLVFLAWLWTGAFGADLTAHTTAGGTDASVSAGAFPLTITIVALGAGVWLFRRATAHLSSPSSVAWFAARTALLTAIPPVVVSWVLYADSGDLDRLARGSDSVLGLLPLFSRVGVSSLGAFVLTLLVTLVTLVLATVVRRDLLSGRAEQVRLLVTGPVVGSAVLLAVLIPMGLLAAFAVWLLHVTRSGGAHYTWHEWMNIVAAAIAFAPNLALWELGLGSGGQIHATASASLRSASASSDTGLHFWAGENGVNHGVWFAVVLAPAVLAVTAYAVVRIARRDGPAEQRRRLGAWVVSLLVVLPCLFYVASVHAHASADGVDKRASTMSALLYPIVRGEGGRPTDPITAQAGAGPGTAGVFLVLLYAAAIALLVALATRIVNRESVTGLRRRLADRGSTQLTDTTETTTAAISTGPYQVGEVVNGWRWDGTQWVPVSEE